MREVAEDTSRQCALIIERLLGRPPQSIAPCATGGNNRVFRVESDGKAYLAKWYFGSPQDLRNRLENEWRFLKYAAASGISSMPQPIARDTEANMALYSFLKGAPPLEVTESLVTAAGEWIVELNRNRHSELAHALPEASESCFSAARHAGLLQTRLRRLAGAKALPEHAAAFRHTLSRMQEASGAYTEKLYEGYAALGIPPAQTLPDAARCLSPSDFGFHNTLLSPEGRLQFIDFEYAGWDDPAKMLCDFFLHPGIPVNPAWAPLFCGIVKRIDLNFDSVIARARLLYPLLGLRWCCIILNVFVPEWAARRQFADAGWDLGKAQSAQLEKAEAMLCRLDEDIFRNL